MKTHLTFAITFVAVALSIAFLAVSGVLSKVGAKALLLQVTNSKRTDCPHSTLLLKASRHFIFEVKCIKIEISLIIVTRVKVMAHIYF